jgi:hypothetical protein
LPNQKNAKISTSKLILKVKNIYIKPLLEPYKTHNNPCFKTGYFGKNATDLLKLKVPQNVTISSGYFITSRSHNKLPKVAKLAKIAKLGHPGLFAKG